MLKKRINKIKTKQKQRQKQMQIVNVNIHKPTRRPREGPTQRKNVQQLPTPQYIYTSQTDSLVPQMFNKQGQQESMPTLSEQINKSLEEKLNKIASQYNISTQPTQPTQQEVRQTRTSQFGNKPFVRNVLFNKPNKTTETKKPITYTNVFNDPIKDTLLTNVQNDPPVENQPILVKSEPVNIYNTVAKSSSTSDYGSDGGFEQKSGFSVKPRSVKPQSGYQSDSVINSKKGMTQDQKDKVREAWTKNVLPNKPEEKIPSLIESIKPFHKPVQEKEAENNDQKLEELKQRIFKLVSENNQIREDLETQEAKKYKARHGTKMSYNKKIDEYKANIKKNNLDIYVLTQQIKSIENKNI